MNRAQGGTFGEDIVRLFTVRASSCRLAQLSLRRRSLRPLSQEAHPSAPRVGNEVEISLNGRHSGAAFPGIKKEGLLLDVHPRAIAATSAKGIETGGMDEGAGISEGGAEGRAALRLCNLVAQSSRDAMARVQAGGREGTDRKGRGTARDYLLQGVQEPDSADRTGP